MDVNVSIGGGKKMALTGAVLVYRGGTDAFAAWHPAKPVSYTHLTLPTNREV